MNAQVYQKLHPQDFLRTLLKQEIRSDGRRKEQARAASVVVGPIGSALGSGMARLGRTKMIAAVTGSVVRPAARNPGRGFVDVLLDLPPMCCAHRFRPGRIHQEQGSLNQLVSEALSSGLLPLQWDALCVETGSLVWSLVVSVICIDYDGNAGDCAILATLAALKDAKLPKITPPREEGQLGVVSRTQSIPIVDKYARLCYPVTFGVFDRTEFLLDLNSMEQDLSEGSVSMLIDSTGKCVRLRTFGVDLDRESIERCLDVARRQATTLANLLQFPGEGTSFI